MSKKPRIKMAVDPLDGPLNEFSGGLVAAAQRLTEEVTMAANTMEKDAIEMWAAQQGLTFDEAAKMVSWDEEEGLHVRVPPPKPEPTYSEIAAEVIGNTVDSTERVRLLLEEADAIARSMVNTPYSLRAGYQKRLLACTGAARNLLYAIKVAGQAPPR